MWCTIWSYVLIGRLLVEWLQELFGELPPPNKVKQMTVQCTWFHERFRMLPADASDDTIRIYARAYIMCYPPSRLVIRVRTGSTISNQ
ncbi:hypothetical protein Ahy_B05g078618 [Arachis hypogaea]|uniref:Aminotransferase-like plant mobile domain-containing protein n=1 Tax=Arachis hypogaea TaxID=3818 RepID=A0A444Z7K5_ARAHY|nr:hypothetical protein Ahy_B05g078618 [Arachis hypogaea]